MEDVTATSSETYDGKSEALVTRQDERLNPACHGGLQDGEMCIAYRKNVRIQPPNEPPHSGRFCMKTEPGLVPFMKSAPALAAHAGVTRCIQPDPSEASKSNPMHVASCRHASVMPKRFVSRLA